MSTTINETKLPFSTICPHFNPQINPHTLYFGQTADRTTRLYLSTQTSVYQDVNCTSPYPPLPSLNVIATYLNPKISPVSSFKYQPTAIEVEDPFTHHSLVVIGKELHLLERESLLALEEKALHGSTLGAIKGAACGVTGTLATTPIEKRRVQLAALALGEKAPPLKEMFTGYTKSVKVSIPNKVFSGLVFMGTAPYFTNAFSTVLTDPFQAEMGGFALAGGLQNFVSAPLNQVVQKMQLNPAANYRAILKQIVANEGYLSLWRGTSGPMIASTIHNMLFFPGTKALKAWVEEGAATVSAKQTLANGFFAGSCTACATSILTHPLQRIAIEQRLQVTGPNQPAKGIIKTAAELGKKAFAANGVVGISTTFYKGLGSTLLRAPLLGGTILVTCEAIEMLLNAKHQK